MSELPKGWMKVPVDDVCQIVRGITFPAAEKRFESGAGLIACLRTANVQANVEWDDLWFVPQRYVKNDEQLVTPDDILISTANSYELVGKVSRVTHTKFRSTLGAFISLLRTYKGVDAGFLYFQMSSESVQRSIREMSSTTTNISNVSGAKLKTLGLHLAPSAEQARIVAKLEELLSDLDAGVAELKAAQKKLAQYRQSLLKAAVEGALTAEWRKARQTPLPPGGGGAGGEGETGTVTPRPPLPHPSPTRGEGNEGESGAQLLQRILQERRARWEAKQLAKFAEQGKTPPKDWQSKYPEPVQPDTTDLPELPEGWVWASGEQLCEFITKGTTPPKELDSGAEKTVPFLRVTNLTDRGELDLADKVFVAPETHQGFLARSTVYPNDVLMNIVGPPLGQVSVVPETFDEWNINQAIAIFRAVEGVLPWFICRYLLSPGAQRWLKARSKTTAGQTNLTLEVCRGLPIPLPPKDEQQALLASLEMALSSLEHQSNAIDLSLKQSTAQRQNILRAAFAGQLVPQDPNDEPASALLARIRAERAARGLDKGPRARGGKKVVDNFGLSHPNSEKV